MEISGDKNSDPGGVQRTSDLLGLCKNNGIKHNFHFSDKTSDRLTSKGGFLEKLSKLNGSVQNSFTKPSIPTLRSRGERLSGGLDPPRRTRRLSKQDNVESQTK